MAVKICINGIDSVCMRLIALGFKVGIETAEQVIEYQNQHSGTGIARCNEMYSVVARL